MPNTAVLKSNTGISSINFSLKFLNHRTIHLITKILLAIYRREMYAMPDILPGCGYVFQDTGQTGELFSIFTRQVRKQLAKNIGRVSERGKKNLTRLAGGSVFLLANPKFHFLLANPKFHSHLVSWRVVSNPTSSSKSTFR
jgi:hypothetical protein